MRMFNQIIGALIEAWGEVKVQRARVILSLLGVTAAVAAMATVIAMGDLLQQSQRELSESWSGREVTLHVTAYQASNEGDVSGPMMEGCAGPGCMAETEIDSGEADSREASQERQAETLGTLNDPAGNAMLTVANRFQIDYWSRWEQGWDNPGIIELKEMNEVTMSGTFHGRPVSQPNPNMGYMGVEYHAVDPDYRVLFRFQTLEGRWLANGDVNQRVTPVVLNSVLWEYFGKPDIDREPLILNLQGSVSQQLRVVGIVKAQDPWSARVYLPYDSWQLLKPAESSELGSGSNEMLVWVGPDQAEEAREILPAALASVLGDGWQAEAYGGEMWGGEGDQMSSIRTIIMAIGAIVIFLGALGLLNVAIVTVRQRIREIGIRRAMGASANRVFFAVFMESVVATFVAGIIGVGIAVIVMQFMPLESMGILLQDEPAFPMSAAIAGVGIATTIGALCGIIPALAAVRVRPIDAIRY
ncbi:FtsX-like permease family protein [Actinomycetaceae bacterium L2_0104]